MSVLKSFDDTFYEIPEEVLDRFRIPDDRVAGLRQAGAAVLNAPESGTEAADWEADGLFPPSRRSAEEPEGDEEGKPTATWHNHHWHNYWHNYWHNHY